MYSPVTAPTWRSIVSMLPDCGNPASLEALWQMGWISSHHRHCCIEECLACPCVGLLRHFWSYCIFGSWGSDVRIKVLCGILPQPTECCFADRIKVFYKLYHFIGDWYNWLIREPIMHWLRAKIVARVFALMCTCLNADSIHGALCQSSTTLGYMHFPFLSNVKQSD